MANANSTPASILNIPASTVAPTTAVSSSPFSQETISPSGSNLYASTNTADLVGGYNASNLSNSSLKLPEAAPAPNPDALVSSVVPGSFMDGSGYDSSGNTVQANSKSSSGGTQSSTDVINQIDTATQTPEQKAASAAYSGNMATAQSASTALQGKGAATLALDEQYGVDKTMKQLQDLNLMIAERTNAYNKLYVDQNGKAIPMEFITGRQAVIKQQAAVELGALSATQAALSGNIKLAQDRADRVVSLQFQGEQQKLDDAKYFLEQNSATLSREESKQAEKMRQAITLQENELTRQKEARSFALTNGITKPFYSIGNTVYSTASGKAFSTQADYKAAGGTGDFSDVQKVTSSMAEGDLIKGDDGTVYVRDASSPTGLRVLIQGTGGYQTVTNPIDGTIYSTKGGKASVMVDANGKVVNNGGNSLVSSNPDLDRVVAGYDLTTYATSDNTANNTRATYNKLAGLNVTDAASAQVAIDTIKKGSPITGQMVWNAAQATGVDPKMIIALAQAESQLATDGSKGARQNNPGNVGNTDSLMAAGGSKGFATMQDGVTAMAANLAKRQIPTTAASNIVDQNVIDRSVMAATKDKAAQQLLKRNVNSLISKGDLSGARNEILTTVQEKMDSTIRQKVANNEILVSQMAEIKRLMDDFKAKGGNTGLIVGTEDAIAKELGRNYSPEVAKIGLQAGLALISFRRSATGVQFSQQENEQYKALFPSEGKVDASNQALIEQLIRNADLENTGYYSYYMGGRENYDDLLKATDNTSKFLLNLTGTGNSTFDSILNQNGW